MKRWNATDMLAIGQKLFTKIYKKRRISRHNHETHVLVREQNDWLPSGVQAMVNGTYVPRYLKRRYFPDEVLDQLHLSDRILQHVLLKQIKATIPHVTNPNCLHVHGPSGVKIATRRIREALRTQQYHYIIRADIRSFYKSILHYKLLNDLRHLYDDPKLIAMFEQIIRNPIETPRGYKNADTGIALRGPLSQFFSAIYLKPLDDAFNAMDVVYIRYADDIILLCKTKRSLNRCRRRMMEVLAERKLTLSRKKSRMGDITKPFHFLGIDYPGTQPLDNTNAEDNSSFDCVSYTCAGGELLSAQHNHHESVRIMPHARTLRKAREQVKIMVATGFSTLEIKKYLKHWAEWWVKSAETWDVEALLSWFIKACWQGSIATYAKGLCQQDRTTSLRRTILADQTDGLAVAA